MSFVSAHTGNEIDLSVVSGSTTTGVIKDFTTLSGSLGSTISSSNIFIGGNTTLSNTVIVGNGEVTGDISASGALQALTITASGDISASGAISVGSTITSTGGNLNLEAGRIILSAAGDPRITIGANNRLTFGVSSALPSIFHTPVSASGFISTDSNITASGNISASGKLEGSELHLNDLIISGTAGGDIFFKNVEVADSYKFLGDNNAVLLEIGPSVNQTTDGLQITQGVGKFTLQPVTSTDNITLSARNAKLQLQTAASNVVTITGSSMHVGGSTEPPEKLTVVGNISSSGFISTDSHITASGNIKTGGILQLTSSAFVAGGQIQASGSIVSTAGIQSRPVLITATDNGSGSAQISPDTSVALINADGDANHIVVLPQPVLGNIIHLIENGTTGYELRTSNPALIGINGGTAANAESAIAGAITYVKCVAVSNSNYICSQFDADGDESKVEAAS